MRRANREVTSFDEIKGIIDRCDVCRIGLATGGAPYIVPMNFGYDFSEEASVKKLTLWFHGAREGRKLDLIGDGCAAGFEMDTDSKLHTGEAACDYSMSFASLIGSGRIEPVADEAERMRGLVALMKHYGAKEEALKFNEAMLAQTCVLKLEVSEFACKRLKK
jgi:nitroimidazol reductase NimA-like FMN-containing flavoprotein (pyridoxamine 5'-phosphate oxidase superfamily)